MKVNRRARPAVFTGVNGERLTFMPGCLGEPFREIVSFILDGGSDTEYFGGDLEVHEVIRLCDFLSKYLAVMPEQSLPERVHTDCLTSEELEDFERLSQQLMDSSAMTVANSCRLQDLQARIGTYQFAPAIPDLSSLDRYELDARYVEMDCTTTGEYVLLQDVKALLAKISMEGGW